MNYPMTRPTSTRATRGETQGEVYISPEGGTSYEAGTIILQSPDKRHTSVLRSSSFEKKKGYIKAIEKLLKQDYTIINGTLSDALIQKLGVKKYVKKLLGEK